MHIFEFALRTDPGLIIMSGAGFHGLLWSLTTSCHNVPAEHEAAIQTHWQERSAQRTNASAFSLRGGSNHIAQAMLAERGSKAKLTFRELVTFCHHITDGLSLPRSKACYPLVRDTLRTFVENLPEDWEFDSPSTVGVDGIEAAWQTAFNEASAPTDALLTGDQLLAVLDGFIATLFTPAVQQPAG